MAAAAFEGGMIALSLGWGVQSFTLAAMSALGELPRVDVAIHADTTHEHDETYKFLCRWGYWLSERGVEIATVRAPNKLGALDEYGACMIPAHIDGRGMFSRQCTDNWKRLPIRRYLQSHRNGAPVELWIGISWDESQRMKDSDVKYIAHRWPLIEKRMSRNDCVSWLKEHDLEIPPKSSCVFCPFQKNSEWNITWKNGDDYFKAVKADNQIRKARPPYDLFVHPARKPLDEIDLRNDVDRGQLSLWDEECTGMCGL